MEPERDEPLIEGLDELPPEAFAEQEEAPELYLQLLDATTAVVRRRRRVRTALAVAAAILLFVAGAVTDRLLAGSEAIIAPEAPVIVAAGSPRPVERPLPADARALEQRLRHAGPEERSRVLKETGDGYLSGENSDPEAALYCYRRLLEDEEHTPVASHGDSDNWLLLYLRLAR